MFVSISLFKHDFKGDKYNIWVRSLCPRSTYMPPWYLPPILILFLDQRSLTDIWSICITLIKSQKYRIWFVIFGIK